MTKKKTKIVKNCLNPEWNEQFEYKAITLDDLRTRHVLECSVWDFDVRGCNDFIGCIRLGPDPESCEKEEWMDSFGEEVSHWEAMLANPEEWVEREHTLRPSIEMLGEAGEMAAAEDPLDPAAPEQTTPPEDRRVKPMDSIMETVDRPISSDEENGKNSDEDSPYGSKTSLYSETCVKGDYTISGEIQVSLDFRPGKLRVTIHSARNLAAADFGGSSDPYIKTYLLPDRSKHSKRLTEIKKKTLNPVYEETVLYDVQNQTKLNSCTLWFSVWDWDRFGKNEFLGEVRVPLSSVDFSNYKRQWLTLQDTDLSNLSSPPSLLSNGCGRLTLALMFQTLQTKRGIIKGTLHVHIQSAKSLPNMDDHGYTDGFVKMCLLPNKQKRVKTRVINDDLNPVWDQKLTFAGVTLSELTNERVLELTVWDYDMLSSNDFIGGLRLGPRPEGEEGKGRVPEWMDSNAREAKHWKDMLSHLGEWVEYSHPLRASMDPVKPGAEESKGSMVLSGGKRPVINVQRKSESGTSPKSIASEASLSSEHSSPTLNSAVPVSRPDVQSETVVSQHNHTTSSASNQSQSLRTAGPDVQRETVVSQHTHTINSASNQSQAVSQHNHTTNSASNQSQSLHTAGGLDKAVTSSPSFQPQAISPFRSYNPGKTSGGPTMLPTGSLPAKVSAHPDGHSRSSIQGSEFECTYYDSVKELEDPEDDYIFVLDEVEETSGSRRSFSRGGAVTGELLYSVQYRGGLLGMLKVQVDRARGLATSKRSKLPYIEICLPPKKKKMEGKLGSSNYIFNHVVKYMLSQSDVAVSSLWIRVWDSNQTGRRLLGEVHQPLSSHNLADSKSHWRPLRDMQVEEQ